MSQNKLRLAFAGTPELASTVLKSLLDTKEHTVEVVLTQPDRPAGRGRKLKQSEVKQVALEHDIPVFQPEKSSELKAEYLENCDLMLVVAYGLLIKPEILAKPRLGCINIHLLLYYRVGVVPHQFKEPLKLGTNKPVLPSCKWTQGLIQAIF